MKLHLLIPAALVLATSGPAFAVSYCYDNRSSLSFSFSDDDLDGFNHNSKADEELQDMLDLKELRSRGVDASSVEDWNGCIRAFVRQPNGGEIMEYYDPNTYQRLN
jgi:hypothetical protein